MAPTICTEKESRLRGRIARDPRKRSPGSSSVISYAGKITHRRSVAVRNASSKLVSLRSSGSESIYESDTNDESVQSSTSSRDDTSLVSNSSAAAVNKASSSSSSSSCTCSERLSPTSALDSDYISRISSCQECYQKMGVLCVSKDTLNLNEESSSVSSTSSSTSSSDHELLAKPNLYARRKNSKGLLEIAIKTIKLIKRNQLLQQKLAQLQFETRAFVESVMANPENRALRDKIEQSKTTTTQT